MDKKTLNGRTFEEWLDRYLWGDKKESKEAEAMVNRMYRGDCDEESEHADA